MTLNDVVNSIDSLKDIQSAYFGLVCALLGVLIFSVAWGSHHV
jgi:hypothetical protein